MTTAFDSQTTAFDSQTTAFDSQTTAFDSRNYGVRLTQLRRSTHALMC
jgi:hypothetical protein